MWTSRPTCSATPKRRSARPWANRASYACATRCAAPDAGWAPQFVTLTDPQTGKLAAAAPVYLKGHSYGEYVFDWAWADAYQRNGLAYYPKLVCALPFTPAISAVPMPKAVSAPPTCSFSTMEASTNRAGSNRNRIGGVSADFKNIQLTAR